MKYLLASILFFTITNCFAIDHNLINADEQYSAVESKILKTENKIENIKETLETALRLLKWEENDESQSETRINNYRSEIEEKQDLLNTLIAQQIETKKILQKLEPLKNEYDRQVKLEKKHQELIGSIIVIIVILIFVIFFISMVWLAIIHHKKYQQLLKDGKITQAEYDRIMASSHEKSTLFSDDRTNPATGLGMIGGCDSGGNPYGSSFNSNSSSETYKTKW